MMLVFILILAQIHITHFIRPHFPQRAEDYKKCECRVLTYIGDFVMPKNGQYLLEYKKLYPATFDGKTIVADAPIFDDRLKPGHGNQLPIYDIDEGLDHVTVQARPGSHWWYTVRIAVPREP